MKRLIVEENTANDTQSEHVARTPLTPRQELRQAWVEWISTLDDWQWFAHFTFREPIHPEQANKRFLRFTRDMNRNLFGRRYGEEGKGVTWVRGLEYQKRDVIHFHVLYGGGVGVLRRLTYVDKWWNDNNKSISRIQPYNKNKGAVYYMTKYVVKGGEMDIYIPQKGIQKTLA